MSWHRNDGDDVDALKQRIRTMEYEAEEAREQRERDREREEQRQAEHRRERVEWMRSRERHADSWQEAFPKQITLLRRELNQELAAEADLADDPDVPANAFDNGAYWRNAIAGCEVAQQAWNDVQADYAPRFEALRQQLADLEAEMRRTVGERVMAATGGDCAGLVEALANNDPDSWLDW